MADDDPILHIQDEKPTISQLKINGMTYDICDAQSRTALWAETEGLVDRVEHLENSVAIVKSGNNVYDNFVWDIETLDSMDTWVPVISGRNIYHKNVGLRESANLKGTGVYANLTGFVCKVNNVCIMSYFGDGIDITGSGRWEVIGTLPQKFRPYRDFYFDARTWSTHMDGAIGANGDIRAYVNPGTNLRIVLNNVVYLVNSVNT